MDHGVLEDVGGPRPHTSLVHEVGAEEAVERDVEVRLAHGRYGRQQLVGEFPADSRSDLRHFLHGDEPVEPRHQRVVQSRRDPQAVHGPGELVAGARVHDQWRLHHRLRELLDEQRDAVALVHDLPDQRLGQGLAAHAAHHHGALAP